jgi:hypothetical protein
VTLLIAELALLGVGRTATSRVALDTAGIASTGEGTLDALIGAISLVVTDLTAVEALASQTTAPGLVGTLASKVASLVAAVGKVSTLKASEEDCTYMRHV